MKVKRSIALPAPLVSQIIEAAAAEGISVSAFVTFALMKEIQKRKKGK